jgi:ribulose-5-phosphate 4-epimerase/fuculose-1-phosphate aldolase
VSADAYAAVRGKIATACRVLAHRGLTQGVLGHVSARAGDGALLIRGRTPDDTGLSRTTERHVVRVDYDGNVADRVKPAEGWAPPKELPIHARLLQRRREIGAVVHAHPTEALLCGLADLPLRPVFGAWNIPAFRMALDGVAVYPRSVLISRADLADEMIAAMGSSRVCLLVGHGITVAGDTIEQATVAAVNLAQLCSVTVELARLGVEVPNVPEADIAELPDLGGEFNDVMAWNSLVADLATPA